MQRANNLKTIKEIAKEIGRGRTYVHAAKRQMEASGINWTANMISVESFLAWVRATGFRCTWNGKSLSKSLSEQK